jgi:hypothetical protein
MTNATVADLRDYLDIEDTTTFTADAGADTLTLASVPFKNTMSTDIEVTLTTSAADLPVPLAIDTIYYVITGTGQNIQLSATPGGGAINIVDAGTGTHTIWRAPEDSTNLSNAINAAINYIEEKTLRVFVAASATRYYQVDAINWDDSRELQLDGDIVTVTELLNADSANTEILAANYWLLDRNLGPPYRAIRIDSTQHWQFDQDEWVSVTGTWGYSAACPADVFEAQLLLAALMYRQASSQVFDITAIPEQGVIRIPKGIPATVVEVIDKYQRRIF